MDAITKRFETLIKECKWTFEDLIKYGIRTEYILVKVYEPYKENEEGTVYFEGTLKDFRKLYLDNGIDLDAYILLFAQELFNRDKVLTKIDILKKI